MGLRGKALFGTTQYNITRRSYKISSANLSLDSLLFAKYAGVSKHTKSTTEKVCKEIAKKAE